MITVKQFIENINPIFEGIRFKSITVDGEEYPIIHSVPTFFGTAFNIYFNCEISRRLGIPYIPTLTRASPISHFVYEIIDKKISLRQNLTTEDLLLLTKEEIYFRSGYYDDINEEKELAQLALDMPLIKDRTEWLCQLDLDWRTLQLAPDFDAEVIGFKGDGDMIVSSTLFEIKCVKKDVIDGKVQRQLIMYYLLNDYRKQHHMKSYNIDAFGYINPLRKQFHVWSLKDLSETVFSNWNKYIENMD